MMATDTTVACQLLHEDEHLIAIHKPEKVPFHSDSDSTGIVQHVRSYFGTDQLYPVHRLDRMTSGLMIFAKTPEANSALSQLIASKQVEKYYLALSSRKPHKKQGLIKGDMEKSRRGSYKLLRSMEKPAVTYFFMKPMQDGSSQAYGYILKPETGKTHQLRVALKSLGSPILGDERYGGEAASRGCLHAYMMRFQLFGRLYCLKDELVNEALFSFDNFNSYFAAIKTPYQMSWPKKAFLIEANIKV